MRLQALLILFFLHAVPCLGADPDGDTCKNGNFSSGNADFGLGVITDGPPASLRWHIELSGESSAPPELDVLASGKTVVTGRSEGQYICVFHYGRDWERTGWVDASRVRALPVDADPPKSAWVGQWSSYGNPYLRIRSKNSVLVATAKAAWPQFGMSRKDQQELVPSGIKYGRIDEPLIVTGNRALAPDCGITFMLLGTYMVSADPNPQCGGTNVRFSAVYRLVRR